MKKKAISAACIILSAVAALGHTLAASADATTSYDFSRPYYSYVSVEAPELLENALGETLGDVERAYLEEHSDLVLKYDNNIASSAITADYNGAVSVEAQEYSYNAKNGYNVKWVPVSVNGIPFTSADGVYFAETEPVDDGTDYVQVTYTACFELDKSLLNGVVNSAYAAAVNAENLVALRNAEYIEQYERYLSDLSRYENYLNACEQYVADEEEYKNYIAQYSLWKADYDEYASYLADYAEYESELEQYNGYDAAYAQYLAELENYREYLVALAQYEEKYAEYLQTADMDKVSTVRNQLAILDFMTTKVNGRTLKSAITGSTVTQVLENKDVLVEKVGADKEAIDLAEVSTENLRSLISYYEECATEEARYGFYIMCYRELVDNFEGLLRSLDYLYRNNIVRNMIEYEGKTEKFRILLAQLFVICNALDDNPIGNYDEVYKYNKKYACFYDSEWRIDGLSPIQIIGEDAYLYDTDNATPLEDGYPADMNQPVRPDEVAEPVPPERISCPTPPVEVQNPGEPPQTVSQPVKPEIVSPPGEEPQPYAISDEESALIAAYEQGVISLRGEFTSNITYYATTVVKKYFRNVSEITVNFFADESCSEPLKTVTVESGSFVEFGDEIPVKLKTGYTCVFDYWADGQGNRVNTDNLVSESNEINLYPRYSETPVPCPVTWVIDGVETTEYCPFGEIPEYVGTPQKTADGVRRYRFVSWDGELTPVTESGARYVAVFEAGLVIEWRINGTTEYDCVWHGQTPEYGGTISSYADSLRLYEFAGWDNRPCAAEEDAVYTAVFNPSYLVSVDGSGARVSADGSYYSVNCYDFSGDTYGISRLLNLAVSGSSVVGLADYGIVIERNNSTLSFPQKAVYALYVAGVESVTVAISQTDANSYKYSVTFKNGLGETVVPECKFSFEAAGVFDTVYSRLYGTSSGGEAEVRFAFSNSKVSFTMDCGASYALFPQYTVSVISSAYADLTAEVSRSAAGETVTLNLGNIAAGMKVGELYAVDACGNRIAVADGKFIMPASDVAVGVVCLYEEYTVKFISDGKILSVRTYLYGDQIIPPPDPVKATDGEYVYTFTGWSQEVGAVGGDTEFVALYSAEPAPVRQATGPSKLMIIINTVTACAIIFAVGLAVLFIYLIVRAIRKRKNSRKFR